MNEIKLIFRPEFLNRIDEIIVFHPLGKDEMKRIVGLMCREFARRAKYQLGIDLTIRDSVKELYRGEGNGSEVRSQAFAPRGAESSGG